MWSLIGLQPKIATYGDRLRQPLIGTVEPLAGRVQVTFSKTLKTQQFQDFLDGLIIRYMDAGKILMVLDNAQTHHSKELEPFLEAHKDKLQLLFLPPYSPELNPMEWFWKFLRKQVSHNMFFDTFKNFQRALIKFIRKFTLSSLEIKRRCCFSKLITPL